MSCIQSHPEPKDGHACIIWGLLNILWVLEFWKKMFVWLDIIGTHKSKKKYNGITSVKLTLWVSFLVAPGIIKPKETIATVKCSFHKQRGLQVIGWSRMRIENIARCVNFILPTCNYFHKNDTLNEQIEALAESAARTAVWMEARQAG